jgi:hypothetical protein
LAQPLVEVVEHRNTIQILIQQLVADLAAVRQVKTPTGPQALLDKVTREEPLVDNGILVVAVAPGLLGQLRLLTVVQEFITPSQALGIIGQAVAVVEVTLELLAQAALVVVEVVVAVLLLDLAGLGTTTVVLALELAILVQ